MRSFYAKQNFRLASMLKFPSVKNGDNTLAYSLQGILRPGVDASLYKYDICTINRAYVRLHETLRPTHCR